MTGTTPPPLQGPTSKEKKYDRQLRLWAASGQAALEEAHILLLNSGPGVTGIETLKNLVLPGTGNFTIHDSAIVAEEDLGVNFFLEEKNIGGFRAEHTCNSLKELNPDVEGYFISEPIESWFARDDVLKPYTLIIVSSPISPEILSKVVAHCEATSTPLLYIHSVGFYSHYSIHLPHCFPIVDTHPPSESTTDLRLLEPWPELSQAAAAHTRGLEEMGNHEHGHVPWVFILLHYLEEWKKAHDGKLPATYKEKTEFRSLVHKGMRTDNPEGGEENFEEAIAAVLKSIHRLEVGSNIKDVFNAEECKQVGTESPNFWIIASVISKFYEKNGVLPLPGALPDMKAESQTYVALQTIYKNKARKDLADITLAVRSVEKALGRDNTIDDKEIEAFCKNAAHIKLVRGRPFHIARPGNKFKWGDRAKWAAQQLTMKMDGMNLTSLIHLYIAFLAYDIFLATYNKDALSSAPAPPGAKSVDGDEVKMIAIAKMVMDKLLDEASTKIEDEDEYDEVKERTFKFVKEIVRAGGAELHNIASLSGGLIAQEVIKVVTKQYVPVDNTCLFDGVTSKTEVLRL